MSRRILVVDDDRSMVRTLCDILRLRGWEPQGATSGTEAVASMSEGEYPLILMDIRMPGVDGVSAFRQIRAGFPNVQVVLMTAYASPEIVRDAEREGVFRVLPKPVDLGTLLPLLARGLRHARPVLLVDDDPAFLRTLSELLILRGFRVVTAEGATDLDAQVAAQSPAVVLIHLRLNGTLARNSIGIVRRLAPAATVVAYSGHRPAFDEARDAIPREWISTYFEKPLELDALSNVLDAALEKRTP